MSAEDPVLGSVLQCLADERRRHFLGYFQNNEDETASLNDLVDHVIEQRANSPAPNRERVTVDLYHHQLPILADNGVVDFDRQTRRVQYRGDEKIEAVMDHLSGHSINTEYEGGSR